jgi:hypothetical protein
MLIISINEIDVHAYSSSLAEVTIAARADVDA